MQSSSLDESVLDTVRRDVSAVTRKLRIVLAPHRAGGVQLNSISSEWELWGPLFLCLSFATILSLTAQQDEHGVVFAAVFFVLWFGAAVVTLNAQLVGCTIVCILGYCVFPLDIAALVCLIVRTFITRSIVLRLVVVVAGFLWATKACVAFFSHLMPPERDLLACFPVVFFYALLSWLVLAG